MDDAVGADVGGGAHLRADGRAHLVALDGSGDG